MGSDVHNQARVAQTQRSAEGTPRNHASPRHTVTEIVGSQLPGPMGLNCLLFKEVLHRRDHPHNLLQLAALVYSGCLIPRQNYEYTLVGLPNAAQVTLRVGGELLGRRP